MKGGGRKNQLKDFQNGNRINQPKALTDRKKFNMQEELSKEQLKIRLLKEIEELTTREIEEVIELVMVFGSKQFDIV